MDSASGSEVSSEEDSALALALLSKRDELTRALGGGGSVDGIAQGSANGSRGAALPYDLIAYLDRAAVHSELGYPDLAAGDAYRALLLCDECSDAGFEYHELALDALRERCAGGLPAVLRGRGRGSEELERGVGRLEIIAEGQTANANANVNANASEDEDGDEDEDDDDETRRLKRIARIASIRCFRMLAISLLLCGCLKSSYDFCIRGLGAAPEDEDLLQAKEYIQLMARRRLKLSSGEEVDVSELPDQGLVRREIYPWNTHEPNRFSQETLDFLNKELESVAPKCEVKVTELPTLLEGIGELESTNKQLGLFAKEDIEPGEEVLDEISLLAANNLLKESLCDACSSTLPPLTADSKVVDCPDCDDIMFCDTTCLERAQESYHPAICNTDIDTIAKDPDPKEKPSALYLLLIGRALAMAATQQVHPLELKEVKYIWGDFLPSASNTIPLSPNAGPPPTWTLPFSFSSNISGPLHVLEKMDIDIFTSLDTYDLWVFNTLYAKFRGTASARVNPRTGHPEVAAVHPLWCLANHDCDPNVRWEWGARMRFWCRERRIRGESGGIKKGEEVLNHYCDIELPVKERREWAIGSLGGRCMCGRCKREAGELNGHGHEHGLEKEAE
ncbi:hypothetical protein LSUB1_G006512 [Lachnellula subtilissima]|uniref:SET domain-containing protein n=1 Tax=Lachnellula subtilissima TaxID=602034 RepID=A0A8H8RIH7_9HELO|nr:hypothetical protein LSUB1_G006512 [Lachnellula subtilissima]